mmetsp:Transcript_32804/g.43174  ORF Transcript_32804/g.43174 Transcript_32804/m.43174 type:complete len:96 (+) Transcript_32804:368-655(+)
MLLKETTLKNDAAAVAVEDLAVGVSAAEIFLYPPPMCKHRSCYISLAQKMLKSFLLIEFDRSRLFVLLQLVEKGKACSTVAKKKRLHDMTGGKNA